jgi:hypothetical protein
MASTRASVEPKAQAAGLAGTAAGVIIWVLSTYAFKGGAVPAGLVSLIYAAVPGVAALVAAYFAPHQARPGDAAGPLSAAAERIAPAPPPVTPPQGM